MVLNLPMIIYDPVLPEDLLSFDYVNLDKKSENYTFSYYMKYFMDHPYDFFCSKSSILTADTPTSMIYTHPITGYVLGRKELKEKLSYHLSGLSVAPFARNSLIASKLMNFFRITGNSYKAWFIDLFVRESNFVAFNFYKKIGYKVYRRVLDYYYEPKEDAFDMRMSLDEDKDKKYEMQGKDIPACQLEMF